jgi:hypothetical protein
MNNAIFITNHFSRPLHGLIPPMNQWAIVSRPLHGLGIFSPTLIPPMNQWAIVSRPLHGLGIFSRR